MLLALEFVVQPLSTLLHELGHAGAALRQGAPAANIMVGRGPWMRFRLGRVGVNFSPLPTRGVMIRGVCRYDGTGLSWRARAHVSLAGPAATFVELVGVAALALLVWPGSSPLLRNLIGYTLIGLAASLIVNLVPTNRGSGPGATTLPNDGSQALRALRLHRDGTAPAETIAPAAVSATTPMAPTPPLETYRQLAQTERERDAQRAAGSIPPPS